MTSGFGTLSSSEWRCVPSSSTMSALSARTRQAARRDGTTESGSYVAFNTSALLMGRDPTDRSVVPWANSSRLELAPCEVVEHIRRCHRMIDLAVLGDETEPHVVSRRDGEER